MTYGAGAQHRSLTYAEYLKVDELLTLQQPRSEGPEHDEMLFIVIHQVYELWFKQILHEMDWLQRSLERNDQPTAMAALGRIRNILKTLVSQVDILETMTPTAFGSFRARLEAASGFQSVQFREIEIVLGRRDRRAVDALPPGPARDRLELRLTQPTLYDSFVRFLALHGKPVPEEILHRDVTQHMAPSPEVQRVLVDVYRNDHDLTQVCERFVDVDEGLQEWRYRHVKMVERTIGTKQGTGGSAGVEYLKTTLFRANFPDLWAIRSEL